MMVTLISSTSDDYPPSSGVALYVCHPFLRHRRSFLRANSVSEVAEIKVTFIVRRLRCGRILRVGAKGSEEADTSPYIRRSDLI